MTAQFIKKISTKTVLGKKVTAKLLNGQKEVTLMRVIGSATGLKLGESDMGAWTALQGRFEATNLETGEVFAAGLCFLPDVALNYIAPAIQSGGKAVMFAIDITVLDDENSPVGYVYGFRPVIEAADPLDELRSQVKALLPAPDKKGKKAA